MVKERISSGIRDFDEMIEGGYPHNRSILVLGTTGTGKTIIGLHLIHQACLDGRKCSIIATEETSEDLIEQAESLGIPLAKYYDQGILTIDRVFEERAKHIKDVMAFGIEEIDALQSNIVGLLDKIPNYAEVVLIDNIGVFTLNMSPNEFRAQFDALIYGLTKRKVMTMFVMDSASDERTGGIAAYSVYGVLRTSIKDNPYTGNRERLLEIIKLRNTKIHLNPIRFDITSNGIVFLKK